MPLDENAGAKQAITNKVLAFDEYQKVIFISQNAVRFGCEWLDQYWPQLPIGIEYFAIGKATAQALQQSYEGLFTEAASAAMNSEDLLTHPKLQTLNGQKILIFRGVGGRDYLCEQLTSRGALVDYCELYQRLCPKGLQTLPLAFRHSSHRPAVAVHSGETLENLCTAHHLLGLLLLLTPTLPCRHFVLLIEIPLHKFPTAKWAEIPVTKSHTCCKSNRTLPI